MEEKIFEGLKHLISYPEGFEEGQTYPLVIYLHGAGSRSETTEILRRNSCFLNLQKRQTARGYILLAPLCRRGNWNECMAILIRLIENMRELPYVDKARLHLTGNSISASQSIQATCTNFVALTELPQQGQVYFLLLGGFFGAGGTKPPLL